MDGSLDGACILSPDTGTSMPVLNIVIMGLGSRGDLEPSLEIAKVLQFHHGHRVRYVTHERYRETVQAAGIEFYSVGRVNPRDMIARRSLDPKEMRRILPEIKDEFFEMGQRYWGACIDDPSGIPADTSPEPFIADAIIATMTTYMHSSVAARMGIPLHLQQTNPRLYTKHLPHSQAETCATSNSVSKNILSWWLKDLAFLLMLQSGFNKLRVHYLGLEPFSPFWWTSQFTRFRIPCSNIWSPHLLQKPADWGTEIDTTGFVFTEEKPYTPSDELVEFLNRGDAPVYVGLGSMSFPNSTKVLEAVFEGIAKAGKRIIFAVGWSGFDRERIKRDDVLVIDEIPHDWIFPKVAAVVIHMGAGTTSMALKCGKPIIMLPIGGDQPFWAHRLFLTGCSPKPISFQAVTPELVAERIREALSPEIGHNVALMAERISKEEPGQFSFAKSALNTFEKVYRNGCCMIIPTRVAVWRHTKSRTQLSPLAASVLIDNGLIQESELTLIRYVEWSDLKTPGDPITGLLSGLFTIGNRFLSCIRSFGTFKTDQSLIQAVLKVSRSTAHLAISPISLFSASSYGFYNLIDYITFKCGGVSHPQQFESNLWTYSYRKMLYLLVLRPFKELVPINNTFTTWLLFPVRLTLNTLNIPVGLFAFSLRAINRELEFLTGIRSKSDVIYNARIAQGRRELDIASADIQHRIAEQWTSTRVKGDN